MPCFREIHSLLVSRERVRMRQIFMLFSPENVFILLLHLNESSWACNSRFKIISIRIFRSFPHSLLASSIVMEKPKDIHSPETCCDRCSFSLEAFRIFSFSLPPALNSYGCSITCRVKKILLKLSPIYFFNPIPSSSPENSQC